MYLQVLYCVGLARVYQPRRFMPCVAQVASILTTHHDRFSEAVVPPTTLSVLGNGG